MPREKEENQATQEKDSQSSSSSETSQESIQENQVNDTSSQEAASDDIKWDDFLTHEGSEEEELEEIEALQNEESSDEGETEEEVKEEVAAEETQEETEAATEDETEDKVAPDYEAIRQILGDQAVEAAKAATEASQTTEQPSAETEQQPAGTEQQSSDTANQESPEQRMEALREQAMTEMSERFQLTEDEVESLREDPNKVLPQLMSKVFINTFDSLMQGINRQLPQQIAQVIDIQQRTAEGQRAFYTVWPQLNKPAYQKVVDRVAGAYRQINPNATQEQIIREVGAQSWIALKLPLDQLNEHVQQFAPPPPAPSPAPKQTFRKPANQNHAPAGRLEAQQQTNEWSEFLDDDD